MRIEADDLDRKRAAEAGQAAAEREGEREGRVHVDAEPTRHALVVDRGADLRTEAGVFERHHQQQRDHQRDPDQEQAVDPESEAEHRHRAAQIAGHLHRLLDRAVHVGRHRHCDEREPDGEKDLVELARPVESAVQDTLEQDADDGGGQKRERQGREKRPLEIVHQGDGDVAAEHREGAVREVDEIHHPERDRQPDR
jgi:hypothetical protein